MSATRAMTPAEAMATAGDERPEMSPDGTMTAIGRVSLYRSARGQLIDFGGALPGNASMLIKPAEARQAAAVLVAYADAAEHEPDPAEIEALARVLHAGRCGLTVLPGACDDCRAGARSALLAGWKRATP